ncbi:TIGR04104 family putative zinc finger protein [Aquibacillus koreensis]|uniref:TIGR04104 family putative zinc finger protein n=1 Tax=Aquibacillus koreensis TaxID=279446 RepID=UPI0038995D5B
MQKCERCQRSFKWWELYKYNVKNAKLIYCNTCSTEHELEGSSILVISLIAMPIAIMNVFVIYLFDLPVLFIFISNIFSLWILSGISPFFIRYRSKFRSNYKTN